MQITKYGALQLITLETQGGDYTGYFTPEALELFRTLADECGGPVPGVPHCQITLHFPEKKAMEFVITYRMQDVAVGAVSTFGASAQVLWDSMKDTHATSYPQLPALPHHPPVGTWLCYALLAGSERLPQDVLNSLSQFAGVFSMGVLTQVLRHCRSEN